MSEGKESPEELKLLGNQAFDAQNYTEAIQYYTKAIALDPTNHVYFSNRSASYCGLEDWEKAAADAKECIRLDPSFLKGYYRLATTQVEREDYTAAMATLRTGLSLDATNAQLLKLQRTVQQKLAADSNFSAAAAAIPQGSIVLDEATKRELDELQTQHVQSVQEYNMVEAQLVKTQRECRVHELTKQELDEQVPVATSADTKCYRSIGKMFLQTNRVQVEEYLASQMEDLTKRATSLTQKMDYLERRIKNQRLNIQELIAKAE